MKSVKKFFQKLLLMAIVIGMLGLMAIYFINSRVVSGADKNIYYIVTGDVNISSITRDNLKQFEPDCILVLGAGIEDENTPSKMLKDRLDVAIALYNESIAPKILLSGDNGQESHNEIHVMLKYVKEAGVPESDIFCDHAGFSTYDSMYRAKSIFNAQSVVVVTQEYHLYRALYIGERLGLDVVGVGSDQKKYVGQTYRDLREILARNKDFFKSWLRLGPTFGGEVIPISGSGISSHGE